MEEFEIDEEVDIEAEVEKIIEINNNYLKEFEKWLKKKKLSNKTISNHLFNAEFFINSYLAYYEMKNIKNGYLEINYFLGNWFIRKAMWSNCFQIKSTASSIKKFYESMVSLGEVQQSDYDKLCQIIKVEMPEWLEHMERYEDMDFDWMY